jgi:osmotically inducible protein OsmC
MPTAQSNAQANWAGDLLSGGGSVRPSSGAFAEVPISWGRRTQRDPGTTSPEELIAAAHSACFCMALSNELATAGTPPERLDASATVAFETGQPGGAVISSVELEVRGRVPGADAAAFAAAVENARTGCPVSKALKGNVEIRVNATLEPGA